MRKKLIIIIVFCSLNTFSQTKKEIDNGIFITFPVTPEYKANQKATSYIGKTENCFFITMILRNQIPNYVQYVKAKKNWTKEETKKVESSFLNNAVKGKLDYTGNKGLVKDIKVGEFNGRMIEYSAVNPATGERGKRYSVLLLVRDKMISIECWLLKDNSTALDEKEKFINSIKTE
ncbi:hypothetical protein ACW5R3_12370 [Bizionia sp. KMM 8389]